MEREIQPPQQSTPHLAGISSKRLSTSSLKHHVGLSEDTGTFENQLPAPRGEQFDSRTAGSEGDLWSVDCSLPAFKNEMLDTLIHQSLPAPCAATIRALAGPIHTPVSEPSSALAIEFKTNTSAPALSRPTFWRGLLLASLIISASVHLLAVILLAMRGSTPTTEVATLTAGQLLIEVQEVKRHQEISARGEVTGDLTPGALTAEPSAPASSRAPVATERVINPPLPTPKAAPEKPLPEKAVPKKELKKPKEKKPDPVPPPPPQAPSSPDPSPPEASLSSLQAQSAPKSPAGEAQHIQTQHRQGDAASSGTKQTGRAMFGVPSGTGREAGVNYAHVILGALIKQKQYPERARRRRITGDVTVKVTLRRDGTVAGASIIEPAESELLNDEVLKMVERAAPFPKPPDNYPGERLEFIIPISFTLSGE